MIEMLFAFYRLEDVCLRLGDKLVDSPLRLGDSLGDKAIFQNLPADIVYVCRTYSASCQEKNRRLEDMVDFFAKQIFIITIR